MSSQERARPGVRVNLTCSYCKDTGSRDELAFCTGCLAPHHVECFAEHGRCSVLGCGGRETVRPGAVNAPQAVRHAPRVTPRPPTQGLKVGPVFIALLCLVLGISGWAYGLAKQQKLQAREHHWAWTNQGLQDSFDRLKVEYDGATRQVQDYHDNHPWRMLGPDDSLYSSSVMLDLTGTVDTSNGRYAVIGDYYLAPEGAQVTDHRGKELGQIVSVGQGSIVFKPSAGRARTVYVHPQPMPR